MILTSKTGILLNKPVGRLVDENILLVGVEHNDCD
jgi:hypothetical protein